MLTNDGIVKESRACAFTPRLSNRSIGIATIRKKHERNTSMVLHMPPYDGGIRQDDETTTNQPTYLPTPLPCLYTLRYFCGGRVDATNSGRGLTERFNPIVQLTMPLARKRSVYACV